MTHPFAGGIAYPWSRPETALLHRRLARDVPAPGSIDLLYKQLGPHLALLNLGQPPDLIWKDALEALARADLLLTLCEVLVARTDLLAVAAAAADVLNARPITQRQILSDRRVILDRAGLRACLDDLLLDDGVKVVLVRGGRESGKSHGRFLFERTAAERGAHATYICSAMVGRVEDVVAKLFAVVQGSDLVPPQDSTPDAWFRLVCIRLQEAAARHGRPLWVAVDDLGFDDDGKPLMNPEIRAFFDQFALTLLDPAVHRWFRLMLIHYPDDRPEPTHWEDDLWTEDRTDAADVQREHVAALLREWSADRGLNLLEDELARRADEVIARAEAPPHPVDGRPTRPRLRRIHDEMTATLRALAGRPT